MVVDKTASQLRRIWLAEDHYSLLRKHAIEIGAVQDPSSLTVLHYGLALKYFHFSAIFVLPLDAQFNYKESARVKKSDSDC